MTLAHERRALQSSRTRALRDARRGPCKTKKSAVEADANRSRHGKPTLMDKRNGMPNYLEGRALSTHVDIQHDGRTYTQSETQPTMFNCYLRTKEAAERLVPVRGDVIHMRAKTPNGDANAAFKAVVLEAIMHTNRLVQIRIRVDATSNRI